MTLPNIRFSSDGSSNPSRVTPERNTKAVEQTPLQEIAKRSTLSQNLSHISGILEGTNLVEPDYSDPTADIPDDLDPSEHAKKILDQLQHNLRPCLVRIANAVGVQDVWAWSSMLDTARHIAEAVEQTPHTQVAAEPVSHTPTDTNRLMADTLKLMACQFRVYATHHEAKGDHDKAQTNASFAELAETVLALAKGDKQ